MNSYYYEPELADHRNECENAEYYYCPTDKVIVHESEKNICPTCLLFIPRVINCICDFFPEYEAAKKEGITF